jgi:uncharacterized HAD superfamily protein
MKTLKISDDTHRKLTATLGTLMAQTGKMQTYTEAVEAILNKSVMLPEELLFEIEELISNNKSLGYVSSEDFLKDAVRWWLQELSGKYEHFKILRDKHERCKFAIKEMNLPFSDVADYLEKQIENLLQQYEKWRQR